MPERLQRVEKIIADAASVTIQELRSHNRTKEFVEARQAVWFIAKDYLKIPCTRLAAIYERDHTTILYGANKIRNSAFKDIVLDGVRKEYPELDGAPGKGELKTIEQWQFAKK